MNIEQKAAKSALTQDELTEIVAGKRLNADTMAVAYDRACNSSKSYYDLSHIEDDAERQQAQDHASGDNAAIYLAMKAKYDEQQALAKLKTE